MQDIERLAVGKTSHAEFDKAVLMKFEDLGGLIAQFLADPPHSGEEEAPGVVELFSSDELEDSVDSMEVEKDPPADPRTPPPSQQQDEVAVTKVIHAPDVKRLHKKSKRRRSYTGTISIKTPFGKCFGSCLGTQSEEKE